VGGGVPGGADDGGAEGDADADVGPAVGRDVVEHVSPIRVVRHHYDITINYNKQVYPLFLTTEPLLEQLCPFYRPIPLHVIVGLSDLPTCSVCPFLSINLLIMSTEKLYFRTPHDKGHAHFYDSIASFPGLHAGPSFEDREKYLRDTIRYQLMSTTPDQAARSTPP
jgi:hypothetical protein